MKKEIKTVLGKATKISCVTCVAAGAIAVMTSGVALKAIGEGGKYVADTVKRIIHEGNHPGEETAVTQENFTAPDAVLTEDAT